MDGQRWERNHSDMREAIHLIDRGLPEDLRTRRISDAAFNFDLGLAEEVAAARPRPLRAFDQIPMRTADLLRQAKMIVPLLADQAVAFIGDMDGAASLIGALGLASGRLPARILVLDFDQRVLDAADDLAHRYGFRDRLETMLYNCFDQLPHQYVGQYDWFYTNPPYGSFNVGESVRLFLTRGIELMQRKAGRGSLIFPEDHLRPWSIQASQATNAFLRDFGWTVSETVKGVHRYHLDDDPDLPSSLFIVERVRNVLATMPYEARRVSMFEIPSFYGRSVRPPFPRFIGRDGKPAIAAA